MNQKLKCGAIFGINNGMKNLFFSLALALFCISCSGDGGNSTSSSSNGGNGGSLAENGQAMVPNNNGEAEKPYTNSGKIYLADKHDNMGLPILTDFTMLEAGTISNGEITLALPRNVDSRFLEKINVDEIPLIIEPLDVEVWFYNDPLRIIDNSGKYIGNLLYRKIISDTEDYMEYHYVRYWYFSKNAKINGTVGNNRYRNEYHIDAKQGWNKVYVHYKNLDQSVEIYYTTDLSQVPDGLKWTVREFAD
jgi:hypothetical protein